MVKHDPGTSKARFEVMGAGVLMPECGCNTEPWRGLGVALSAVGVWSPLEKLKMSVMYDGMTTRT